MNDTKFFVAAFEEYTANNGLVGCAVADLTIMELSDILRKAQKLKDAEKALYANERTIATRS